MKPPTYLYSTYICLRCDAKFKTRIRITDATKADRKFEKNLKICQDCASCDLLPWAKRPKPCTSTKPSPA